MYCSICGSEVNNGEQYCPVCGAELLQGQVIPFAEMKTTPISEIPTTRVTITGDTDNLTSQQKSVNNSGRRREKTKKRVKVRPRKLALKVALFVILLVGIGVGVFFGIRFLKNKKKTSAYYKQFTFEQVAKTADNANYVCGQLLLHTKEDVPESRVKTLAEEKHGSIVGQIPISNDYQIEFEDRMMKENDLKAIMEEWKQKDKIVASVQLHYAYGTEGGFNYQDNPWKDDNNDKAKYGDDLEWDIYHPADNNWAVESVWAPLVWDSLETGAEYQQVEVGIVDTVFDTTHKDLTDRFAPLKKASQEEDEKTTAVEQPLVEGNPIDLGGNPKVKDDYEKYAGTYDTKHSNPDEKRLMHGTHVAGIIAANMDDEFGMTGVAQNAKLHGFAMAGAFDAEEKKTYSSAFEWKYALSRMLESDIRLINVSMQLEVEDTSESSMSDINADMEYFLQECIGKGYDFLLVKSAGDEKLQDLSDTFLSGISTQAIRDRIFVAGGAKCEYDEYDVLQGYVKTNSTNYGERIDIYAPGPNVLSDIPGDRTEKRSGTSGSAAFVTGGCALVMGILPDATMAEVKEIVQNNCCYNVKVTVSDNGQTKEVERGYLNLFLATETAKARNESTESSNEGEAIIDGKSIREWVKEKIQTNSVPRYGILELSLGNSMKGTLSDVSGVRCVAVNGKNRKTLAFSKDGKINEKIEPGEWKLTIECDGFDPYVISVNLKAGETISIDDVILKTSFNWREAYVSYLKNKDMFVFKTQDGYTKCPDRILLKDFDDDGIPEICYGYYYAIAMELSGYVVQCLYIKDQDVQEKTLAFHEDMDPIMQEGLSFDLEDQLKRTGDRTVRSKREADICSYILDGDYKTISEVEEKAYALVGEHIVLSETIDSLTVGYYDGILYLTLAVITGDVSDSYYRGYVKWEDNKKLRIEMDDSGYSASRLRGYFEVVDGRIVLTDVETSVRSPDEIIMDVENRGTIRTAGKYDEIIETYPNWKKGYLDFIRNDSVKEYGLSFYTPKYWEVDSFDSYGEDAFIGVFPIYINGDDIPELVFQWGMNRTTIIATWNDEEGRVDSVIFNEPDKYGYLVIDSTNNVIWYGDGKQGDYREEFLRVQNGKIDGVAAGRFYWDSMSDMGNGDEWDYSKAKMFWSSGHGEIQCTKQQYDQYKEEFGCEEGGDFNNYADYIVEGNGFTSVSQLKKWIEK